MTRCHLMERGPLLAGERWEFQMSNYVMQKLWGAVDSLLSAASIQDRLYNAALQLSVLNADDFPEDECAEFSAIRHALTEHPSEGEGTILASTRKMTPEEGAALAHRIFSLYTRLRGGIWAS
jgi:hypothetical protein